MAGDDDADDGEDDGAGALIMPAMAYPLHIVWVPWKLCLYHLGFWATLAVLTIQPLFFFGWIPIHAYLAAQFLRDPYFFDNWVAWWQSRRWPASRRTPSLRPAAGNRYIV